MDLYQAILSRRSVRRYRNIPLSHKILTQIDEIATQVTPLVPKNRFVVMRRDVLSGEDLIAAMGGYGRILSPPHFMTAYISGEQVPLVDLGYRMEQIAIQMIQIGVSVCFIGSLGRENDVRIRFRLLRDSRTAAFLIFGYPAETMAGRTINAVLRRSQNSNHKLAADRLFYSDSFEHLQTPPQPLLPLIEAGRLAPSANNAQPWRFLWHKQALFLFIRAENPRYGHKALYQNYRFFDAGTCMANISLAMRALNIAGSWTLLSGDAPDIPVHPRALLPVARLTLA